MSEVIFVDGQSLSATNFGQFSNVTSQWSPILYTGTYGTNGFHLNFNNVSSVAALGYDTSGNSNNWTVANVSLTAGVTYDVVLDSPTTNYPVLNSLIHTTSGATGIVAGNLQSTISTVGSAAATATFGVSSGKWYWEVTVSALTTGYAYNGSIGVTTNSNDVTVVTATELFYLDNGNKWTGSASVAYGASYTTGNIIGVALDVDNGTLTFYKNGVSQGVAISSGITGNTWYPVIGSNNVFIGNINFGQQPFVYTPPTGFTKLNTTNLPTPSIPRGDTGFKTVTYVGNGGELQIGESQFPKFSYNITKSLRFRPSASSQVSRAQTNGNGTTWTFSGWFKRSSVGTGPNTIFCGSYTAASQYQTQIYIYTDDTLRLFTNSGSGTTWVIITNQLFRDVVNWNHITVAYDATQATSTNRVKIWINGTQITSFSSASYPALNEVSYVNQSTYSAHIGNTVTSSIFDGYIAECYLIDGTALTPTSFGAFDVNGYWIPQAYTGNTASYGTNGFYLKFSNATSTANLGLDSSGNGNTFTTSGLSIASDYTYDSVSDSPTNNFCTIDPLSSNTSYVTYSNGALTTTSSVVSAQIDLRGSLFVTSGKYYWEFTPTGGFSGTTNCIVGIANRSAPVSGYPDPNQISYNSTGVIMNETRATIATVSTYTVNDVIGIAVDATNNLISFYKNNTLIGTYSIPYSLAVGFSPYLWTDGTGNSVTAQWNFGQQPYKYTAPTGYNTLSMANIAEYIYDLEKPDFVWIKSRSAATNHMLFDSTRGTTNYISSNATTAQTTDVNSLITFDKNGFYIGNNTNINTLQATYAAWMWKAGTGAVTNTNGTITSMVNANTTFGFSIVTYTGTGANATVGHGLGITPSMVIIKALSTTSNWSTYHSILSNTQGMYLNSTNALWSDATVWNSTSPTSLVLSLGSNAAVNSSAVTFVAYCFTPVTGYSFFGSYTGNSANDGPFIYTGFKPRWIMVKNTAVAGDDWLILDTVRDTVNGASNILYAEVASAESTGAGPTPYIDVLSNGFKLRSSNTDFNNSGSLYAVVAFAETPFNYATAR